MAGDDLRPLQADEPLAWCNVCQAAHLQGDDEPDDDVSYLVDNYREWDAVDAL